MLFGNSIAHRLFALNAGGSQLIDGRTEGGVLASAVPLASRRKPAAAATRARAAAASATATIAEGFVLLTGTHTCSSGKDKLSSSRRKIRSILSSGDIPHLPAHPRFRLRERRADSPGLHAEVPRDLAVIEAEVELRDDHRPLALGKPGEKPSDLHSVESRFNLVVAAAARHPFERQERKMSEPPGAPDGDHEKPAREIGIVRGRMA